MSLNSNWFKVPIRLETADFVVHCKQISDLRCA
jgi:hypothetical protein